MMALAVVELETVVSELGALTNRPPPMIVYCEIRLCIVSLTKETLV